MQRGFVLAAALLLAACGSGENDKDALSADEDRQLNEAAAMLDEPADEEGGDDKGDAEED